ncbi:MAG: type II toxin-antitoxin system HicB family antitoxin [Nevskiales bacterium]
MKYPIAIEPGDSTHAYGVAFPDMPGCYSAGDSFDEALANAEEAALLWLEDHLERGHGAPAASRIEDLRAKKEYRGWVWAFVSVDLSKLSKKAIRVNVTLPETLLTAIDNRAERIGETRSGFLAQAAMERLEKDAA